MCETVSDRERGALDREEVSFVVVSGVLTTPQWQQGGQDILPEAQTSLSHTHTHTIASHTIQRHEMSSSASSVVILDASILDICESCIWWKYVKVSPEALHVLPQGNIESVFISSALTTYTATFLTGQIILHNDLAGQRARYCIIISLSASLITMSNSFLASNKLRIQSKNNKSNHWLNIHNAIASGSF